jgi:hypothetical protein
MTAPMLMRKSYAMKPAARRDTGQYAGNAMFGYPKIVVLIII